MTKNEYIEVDSIVERSGVLAMAMSRLAIHPPRRPESSGSAASSSL
jgi:hypothetical protein